MFFIKNVDGIIELYVSIVRQDNNRCTTSLFLEQTSAIYMRFKINKREFVHKLKKKISFEYIINPV